jgi:tripeptidyl-peptidase-1
VLQHLSGKSFLLLWRRRHISILTFNRGGIVTLLNEARLAAKKGPIGFLNPTLYAHPEAFNDITKGSNPGCGSEGFKAQPGWDPVTGLGSPKYDKLVEVFLSLP